MPDSDTNNSQSQDSSRPRPLPRYSSHSKRHASFHSPREVPLPSPTLCDIPNPFSATAPSYQPASSKAQDVGDSPPHSPSRSDLFYSQQENDRSSSRPRSPSSPARTQDDLIFSWRHRRHHSPHMSLGSSSATPVALSTELTRETRASAPRTTAQGPSEPGNNANKDIPQGPSPAIQGSDFTPIYPLRAFSLPDAQSVSYCNALSSYLQSPSASPSMAMRSTTWIDRCSSASLPLPSQIPFYVLPRINPNAASMTTTSSGPDADNRASSSSSLICSSSSSTQVPLSGSGTSASPDRSGLPCPPLDESNSSSGSSFGSTNSTTSSSPNTENSFLAPDKPSPLPASTLVNETTPRASNPPGHNASRPPPRPVSPFRAPQQPAAQPMLNSATECTAMRRFMSPVEDATAYPPPEPPVILPAEPTDDMTQPSVRSQAAYVPFLSHAPPPPDSWIHVETSQSEYKLLVRLPGFSREGITLATKRRRILHVVADSWENGGGHFERRISFGYDADLVHVRAEFDGVMLRITIPRRISPVIWSSSRPGPIGRA